MTSAQQFVRKLADPRFCAAVIVEIVVQICALVDAANEKDTGNAD